MAITASMVKELREMTGAGMMDCKKALNETNGDMDAAVEFLRKNGQAKAEKKASRIAAEGVARAAISADGKTACVIEVNSETDFVAKNEGFVALTKAILDAAVAAKAKSLDEVKELEVNGRKVADLIVEEIGKTGEKMELGAYECLEGAGTTCYDHLGNKLSTIATFTKPVERQVGRNVAMQIASMNPTYVSRNDMPQDVVEHERSIQEELLAKDEKLASKPEKVKAGIIEGRVSKSLQDMCLVDQEYFLDADQKCGQYLKSNNAEVLSFVKYVVGEGIEKKEENFAAEVAAMAK